MEKIYKEAVVEGISVHGGVTNATEHEGMYGN